MAELCAAMALPRAAVETVSAAVIAARYVVFTGPTVAVYAACAAFCAKVNLSRAAFSAASRYQFALT